MTRPTRDRWGLALASVTATRSTCLRRHVGCVLIDQRGHILATGYNGVAAGQAHCNEERIFLSSRPPELLPDGEVRQREVGYPNACPGAQSASGTNLDGCHAIHAEQNALIQCRDVWEIDTCYVTASPCITCVKMLLNTSCKRIVFSEAYPHSEAQDLWVEAGRFWIQLN